MGVSDDSLLLFLKDGGDLDLFVGDIKVNRKRLKMEG